MALASGTVGRRLTRRELAVGSLFLVPAAVLLGLWVVYPAVYTVWRSFFDASGDHFVGLAKYREMFSNPSTRTAIRNNAVWVVVAPTIVTAVGLVFAVLIERVRFGSAFKIVVFMPMAISFLAAGVIFRFVYDENPDRGLANAVLRGVGDVVRGPGPYAGARPSQPELAQPAGGGFVWAQTFAPGDAAGLGLVGLPPARLPKRAGPAVAPAPQPGAVSGTVWLDFSPGADTHKGAVDAGERGMPGAKVEALDAAGKVAGSDTTGDSGQFRMGGLDAGRGPYHLRLSRATFRPPWDGLGWLGPSLITPAVIGSFIWIWAGFAMVVIAAGLASIPRETMEAARVDGANEWQVFRRVTVPLLWPVLLVVAVTLTINVLKIFDLVLVIPPGSVQDNANVIALELWRVSFGGGRDQGLGSALGVLLFVLVLPAMSFNIRRFRRGGGA
jgi:alpha-glucoside transport system permease protein